jgi:electron transfer flavoprotein beta subunit
LNILVPVKQVPDPNAVRFDSSGSYAGSTPRVVNEYDQYAIEEAIRLKEAGVEGEIVVMTVGPAAAKDAVTRGLAMGADRGILVSGGDGEMDSLQVASIIAAEAKAGDYDLIFVGQETSDGGTGNVGPQVAALLGYPLLSNVVKFELDGDSMTMEREVEDGRHVVTASTPAVICALTGLNEPRYPSLKGIMAARRKPIEEKQASSYETTATGARWGRLYAEKRVVEGTIIETDAESAAKQVVEILRERKLI